MKDSMTGSGRGDQPLYASSKPSEIRSDIQQTERWLCAGHGCPLSFRVHHMGHQPGETAEDGVATLEVPGAMCMPTLGCVPP